MTFRSRYHPFPPYPIPEPQSKMVEIRSNTLRSLYYRPLQSFKIIEDLTTTLHQDIQRQCQYHQVMYADNIELSDQAMATCMEVVDDTVREYESNVPYHACGRRGIKIWAGTGDRVKQAALWGILEKSGVRPAIPHAMYKRVMDEFREIIECEEIFPTQLGTSGVRLSAVPLSRSLANDEEAEVGRRTASAETSESSTTLQENTAFTPSPEPVDRSEHRRGYDCVISPETCRCQRPRPEYFNGWGYVTDP